MQIHHARKMRIYPTAEQQKQVVATSGDSRIPPVIVITLMILSRRILFTVQNRVLQAKK